MAEIKDTIRERLKSGQDLSKIKGDLVTEGYSSEEVDKAAALFDWKAEKKYLVESGKQEKYEKQLQRVADDLFVKKIIVIVVGGIAALLSLFVLGVQLGVFVAAGIVVVMVLTYSGMRAKGIH